MTRRIYLIRHAMPDIPLGERWCIGGRSDPPLGPLGRLQAALLSFVPQLQDVNAVYCSRLSRSLETARAFCSSPLVQEGLEEQDMGEWDGLPFSEIQARWPELYAARERQPELLPLGAESMDAVRARVSAALLRCLAESGGELAAVSHKSAIASLLGSREGLDYTAITALCFVGGTLSSVEPLGPPHPPLEDTVCLALLHAAGADQQRIAHCRAVAALAQELCTALAEKGLILDSAAVRSAALLHDIARAEPEHAALGARWLRELGYEAEAELVRQHHDPDSTALTEAAVVYLADKAVRGNRRVRIGERFAASALKCTTSEARAAHRRRLETAIAIQEQINRLCGAELIP